ncbi:MAG: hypothetical protein QGI83_13355 [Candidatus Latescibacteria bacterium]|jgi:hypothetical protein|nr:hypothetical protein [Candidatus Latescibacterota bacterium]
MSVKTLAFERQLIDANPIGTHESKLGDFGNGKPSVVIKLFRPHNRVELFLNVTE